MPLYQNTYPPSALPENVVGYSWGVFNELNALGLRETFENLPLAGASGARFGIHVPQPSEGQGGRIIGWKSLFNGTMSAVQLDLMGAYEDVPTDYVVLDSSTNILGEMRSVANVRCKFLLVRVTSLSAGTATGLIAKILG